MHQLAFKGHDPRASVLYLSDESGQSFELPVSDELLRALGVHKTQSQAAGASDSAGSSVTIIDQTDPTASNAQNERSQDNATTGRNTTTGQGQMTSNQHQQKTILPTTPVLVPVPTLVLQT